MYVSQYAAYVQTGYPLAFLSSSGATPNIKSGGTNNQDLLFTTGTGNPTRLQISSTGEVIVKTNGLNLENATATNSRGYSITNAAGTTGWTFGNGITASSHQFVIYDNTAGAARLNISSKGHITAPVSYTHLTLPTILRV